MSYAVYGVQFHHQSDIGHIFKLTSVSMRPKLDVISAMKRIITIGNAIYGLGISKDSS